MLEGNEFEKKFDGGEVILDVTEKGDCKISASYEKEVGEGIAKVKSVNSVETNIFKIAELIAAKTQTPYDDKLVAGLKNLLGIV